jgi:hypothetical protein
VSFFEKLGFSGWDMTLAAVGVVLFALDCCLVCPHADTITISKNKQDKVDFFIG